MRLGANRGLLDPEDKKEPVRLNSLLGDIAEGASEMIGDTLGGLWSFMSNPSEQKVADANAEEEAIKQLRLNDGMGNDWMYKTTPSDNPNKFFRFFENIPDAAAQMYLGSSRMARVPEETIKPVGNLIAGGVLNATGGLLDETVGTEQRATANAFADVVGNTFESWDNFTDVIANNPLDFIGILVGAGYTAKSIADLANNPAIKSSFRNTLQALPDPIDLLANNKMVSQFIPDPRAFAMMWHGSPSNFVKLDNKFMLTGEGNNVKGAGFYMGGRASTSKQYFGQTDKYNSTYDTTDFDLFQDEVVTRRMLATTENNPLVAEMWKDVTDNTATPSEVSHLLEKYKDHSDLPKLKKAIVEYKELWADQPFSLMKFDVADKKLATFLDDSKGVYDQPQAVKDLIRQENGAYMDLVEAYKQNVGNKIQQDKILAEIDLIGDFPHPDNGIDLYEFFVDRRAEFQPSADMTTHNLEVSKYLHENGVMGRRWGDDLTTKYPDVYDTENYLIFDESTAKMFERNEVPVIPDPMIATHNMSEEALMKHTGQGKNKIPMPSMAISKTDGLLENFGDITLLGTPKMITPSATTNTYNSDMYSGRAPHDFANYKNIDEVFNSIDPQEMQWHIGHTAPNWLKDGDIDYTTKTGKGYLQTMRRKFEDWSPGQLERQMLNVDTAKANGYNPYDYENYREMVREVNKAHVEKHGNKVGRLLTYNSDTVPPSGLLGESIQMMSNPKGYRTPAGKRRPDVPYDPELAFKIMKKKKAYLPGTEMEGNSVGQTRALTSKKFKNLQEIKDSRDSIVQRGLFHDIGDEFELARDDVRLAIKNDKRTRISYNDNDNVYDMIEEMLRGNGKVPKEYMNMFDQSTRENLTWVEDLVKELKNKGKELETTYFESKSKRLVDMNEFKGALIPKETSKYIEKLLKDAGIQKILRYGSSKERMELLKKFPELQFIGLAMPTSGLLMNQGEEERTGLLL